MEDTTIRVLALDLDGTLTNDEKKITPAPAPRWMRPTTALC